ncbi:MAG: hypothetical protein Tsb0021_02340 [Chlamydiales bacterium]
MKLLKYLMPAVLLTTCILSLSAEAPPRGVRREVRERDYQAVQEFVNSKRTIPLEQKDCNLTISGDVRFDWASVVERVDGFKLRGKNGLARQNPQTGLVVISDDPDAGFPFSTNEFDIVFNLYLDYVCDRSWAVAWLQFDNFAGIEFGIRPCSQDPEGMFGSGTCDHICLRKAYIGYNLCADGCTRFDIELGRRPLYNVFDSRVQFQNRFDGILFRYAHNFGCWGDLYWNTGLFVVDERVNHYAYVTEMGLLNPCDYGFDIKYSFIDWRSWLTQGRNRCLTNDPIGADFRVSQITLHYNTVTEYLCQPLKLYGAFLINHDAKGIPLTLGKKENLAWYAGILIGEVCRAGDWAFDVNYQYVEAQAIPSSDVSGIGDRANVLRQTFTSDGRGFTNYKGWHFEALYALTDNLSIDAILEFLTQIDRNIGGSHSYSKFEIEAIYAF